MSVVWMLIWHKMVHLLSSITLFLELIMRWQSSRWAEDDNDLRLGVLRCVCFETLKSLALWNNNPYLLGFSHEPLGENILYCWDMNRQYVSHIKLRSSQINGVTLYNDCPTHGSYLPSLLLSWVQSFHNVCRTIYLCTQ